MSDEPPFQDAYVFVPETTKTPEFLDQQVDSGTATPFMLATGSFAKLYVLKGDTTDDVLGFLNQLGGLEVQKAVAIPCVGDLPHRIVHFGPFRYMAFVSIVATASADPCELLETLSHFATFKGGAVVQGDFDVLVEFADPSSSTQVQRDAQAVRGVPGVEPTPKISLVFNP
jgi:hypothetical protein